MKNSITLLLLCCIAVGLLTCREKEPVIEREFPRLDRPAVVSVNKTGLQLTGRLLSAGGAAIVDHGFLWTEEAGANVPLKTEEPVHWERVSLGSLTGSAFEAAANYGLKSAKRYTVCAFVRTSSGLMVYGPPVGIEAEGSNAPVISRIIPEKAMWGDTVTIEGQFFGHRSSTLSATFTFNKTSDYGTPVRILASTPTTIRCIIPDGLQSFQAVIVSGPGGTGKLDKGFELDLSKPVISGFSPQITTFNETLTINGTDFGGQPRHWQVYFWREGNTSMMAETAPVEELTKTSLRLRMPELPARWYTVSVARNGYGPSPILSNPIPTPLLMKPPVIESVSPVQMPEGREVTIRGDGFSKPEVTFASAPAQVARNRGKEIFILPDNGIYPTPGPQLVSVTVSATGRQTTYTTQMEYTGRWVRRAGASLGPFQPNETPVNAFQAGEQGYVVARRSAWPESTRLLRYDPQRYQWELAADVTNVFSNFNVSDSKSFSIGATGYVYLDGGLTSNPRRLLRLQPGASQFDNVNLPPAGTVADGSHRFTFGGDSQSGYLMTAANNGQIWIYRPATNQWELLSDAPNLKQSEWPAAIYRIGDILYVVCTESNWISLYSLDLPTQQWKRVYDRFSISGHVSVSGVLATAVNGKGYLITTTEVIEADPATGLLTRLHSRNPQTAISQSAITGFRSGERFFVLPFWSADLWETSLKP